MVETKKKVVFLALLTAVALLLGVPSFSQDQSSARGSLSGEILDATKSLVPGAQVTITGPIGSATQTSNDQGTFYFSTLIPGKYSVKIQKSGFRVTEVKDVEVLINKTTTLNLTLETGQVSEVVEVSGGAVAIDTTSSSINSNLSDTFYQNIPVQRNVASLFYLAPGVASGLRTGNSNPSISGGSGLENEYVADGVSINDPAYGGMGVWSRVYGALGTGINLTFVKEVQVKTAAFEPQYGHSTGGIVQIVTKSGSTETHGVIGGFFNTRGMQDVFANADDTQFATLNKIGRHLEDARYEGDFELGGYVPGSHLKNHLFYFGNFNPTWNYAHYAPAVFLNGTPSGLYNIYHGDAERRTLSLDYAGKLTYKISDSHTIESSVFGDPNTTNNAPFSTLNSNNASANSNWDYGTRNWSVRYDGVLSPTLTVDGAFSWSWNHFTETPASDIYNVLDRTQTAGLPGQVGQFNAQGLGLSENYESNTKGYNFDVAKVFKLFGNQHTFMVGGLYQTPNYDDITIRSGARFTVPTANASNVDFLTPASRALVPADATTNATFSLRVVAPGSSRYTSCTLCPYMDIPGYGTTPGTAARVYLQQTRGTYSNGITNSTGKYYTLYVNDSWEMGRHATLNVGLRWEQQRINGNIVGANFANMWDPRASFIVDPKGDHKSKIYVSFSRLPYVLPLDAAIRSLSSESDDIGILYAPQSDATGFVTLNSLGTVNVIPDNNHVLNFANGGIASAATISAQSGAEPFQQGVRMEYNDEWVVGGEHEFRGGIVATARYVDRRLKRVVEDFAGISMEGAFAGLPQNYVIGNPSSRTDLIVNENEIVFSQGAHFVTPTDAMGNALPLNAANMAAYVAAGMPSSCFDTNGNPTPFVSFDNQNSIQAATGVGFLGSACFPATNTRTWTDALGNTLPDCTSLKQSQQAGSCAAFGGEVYADGKGDGFKQPIRNYQAVEFEVRKDLSHNWAINSNFRIARLRGNYEGAFRNDNNQADPGISSLYDFTPGLLGMLGAQQGIGPLNSDRTYVFNAQTTYIVPGSAVKGLVLGANLRVQSGVPLSTLAAQPAYINTGEVPLYGRGDLGRAPTTGTLDVHLEYPHKITEKMTLRAGIDLFNILDTKRQTLANQNPDLQYGILNADFQNAFRDFFIAPFQARAFVKLIF